MSHITNKTGTFNMIKQEQLLSEHNRNMSFFQLWYTSPSANLCTKALVEGSSMAWTKIHARTSSFISTLASSIHHSFWQSRALM
jgi:hypothetical protein